MHKLKTLECPICRKFLALIGLVTEYTVIIEVHCDCGYKQSVEYFKNNKKNEVNHLTK